MYKSYPIEDFLRVADECAGRLNDLLKKRYAELEEMREDINDGYRHEDLDLKCAEVDDEKALIRLLLEHLRNDTEKLKAETRQKWHDAGLDQKIKTRQNWEEHYEYKE